MSLLKNLYSGGFSLRQGYGRQACLRQLAERYPFRPVLKNRERVVALSPAYLEVFQQAHSSLPYSIDFQFDSLFYTCMNAVLYSFWVRLKLMMRTMRHIFPSSHYAILALFFMAGLELAFALRRFVFLLIAVILGITVIGIILVRAEERDGFHPTQAILPTLAAFSLAAFALFLPTSALLHMYFVGSSVVFFLLLKHGARQAYPTWNWVITLVVLFLMTAAILGWRFSLYAPLLIVFTLLLVGITFLAMQSLLRYTGSLSEAWLLSLTIGLVLTEVAWVLQFLSLHFMVQAGVLVASYYILFQLTATSFERMVRRKDIWEYLLIGGGAIMFLLVTARWL